MVKALATNLVGESMRKLFVTFFVLAAVAGVLYGADRFAVDMAEGQIGKQVAAQAGLTQTPGVNIEGFPFLTQVMGGQYDRITMDVGEISQRNLTITGVKTELTKVQAPFSDVINGDTSQVVAQTVTVSGVVPFSVVEKNAPDGVKISADGSDLRLEGKVNYAGFSAPFTATVAVKVTRQGVGITPKSVQSQGGREIPVQLVRRQFGFSIPLRNLPLSARVSDVEVADNGLRIAATAENVKLSGSSTQVGG